MVSTCCNCEGEAETHSKGPQPSHADATPKQTSQGLKELPRLSFRELQNMSPQGLKAEMRILGSSVFSWKNF